MKINIVFFIYKEKNFIMEIRKFNGFNNLNESKIDNVVINDSIDMLLKDLKGYVWDNVSRYDNDIRLKGNEYEFKITYDVVSEKEFISLVEKFLLKTMGKYNISKIDRLNRGLYLFFTYNEDTYSIPLILTMSGGDMVYEHGVKYNVWLNMNLIKKI